MNSYELAKRICDCLSDGYDDEETREETETALYNELSQISNDSFVKIAFLRLCERVEELENDQEVEVAIHTTKHTRRIQIGNDDFI